MIPIVTPAEMAAIDAAAPEPVEVLIERAGAAVARAARELLGGTYGRRVVVLHGRGNNGADGRVAARRLAERGVRVVEIDAFGPTVPELLPAADLVIDAALGTGLSRPYTAPSVRSGTAVLAVDIPSGVDGATGRVPGRALAADRTVTFAALKPGLVLAPGRWLAGDVEVADIGLDVSRATAHLVTAADVARWVPRRRPDDHKWRHAVWVVAGSPGMTGAAHLTARAAMRAGSGYVRLSVPGLDHDAGAPTEVVSTPLDADLASLLVPAELARFGCVALGPGLGRGAGTVAAVRRAAAVIDRPLVIDGDGLAALGADAATVLAARRAPTILTPHEGELRALGADAAGTDVLGVTRALAAATGAVVLRKGPTTVVAAPDGRVLCSVTGDERLATAGTGDVLTGVVAAFVARGVPVFEAAAAGAFVHGLAAGLGAPDGLVAGDVAEALPATLAALRAGEVS